MGGSHGHFIDEDKEEEDVYMNLTDMTPDEEAEFRAACHA